MSSRKSYYICRYFRIKYLLKVIPKAFWENQEITLYYLLDTQSSRMAEACRGFFAKIFAGKIKIQKFPFNVTEMYDENNKRIVEVAYCDSMYQLMDQLESAVLNAKGSLLDLVSKKLSFIKGDLKLWIKHYIAWPTFDNLLLMEIAFWLFLSPKSALRGAKVGVIIDKKSYGMDLILGRARKKNLSILTFRSRKGRNRNIIIVFFYQLINLIVMSVPFAKRGESTRDRSKGRICTFHDGCDNFTNFYDKRNYSLFWYPGSGISSDRITIFSRKSRDIHEDEVKRARAAGFNLLSCNGLIRKAHSSMQRNHCTLRALCLFFEYTLESMKLLFQVRSKAAYEEWKILSMLFFNLPYWEDFFTQHNIKIFFKPGTLFADVDVAAKLSGSAIISYQYSNHSKIDMGHQDNCDTFFIWGKAYERVYQNKHSEVKHFIQSGYIFGYTFDYLSNKAEVSRKRFSEKGVDFIIGIFDESLTAPQFIFGDDAQRNCVMLYRSLFEYVLENPKVGLVIKPKKNINENILKSLEQTSGLIRLLEEKGRVEFLDAGKLPVEAGKISDLVLGVVADSSAALECLLAGVPAFFYDSVGQKNANPENVSGLDRITFDNIDAMMAAVEHCRQHRNTLNEFANEAAAFLKERDPFRDGKANERIGFYIRTLLSNIDQGLAKDIAIKNANKAYGEQFGDDKLMTVDLKIPEHLEGKIIQEDKGIPGKTFVYRN